MSTDKDIQDQLDYITSKAHDLSMAQEPKDQLKGRASKAALVPFAQWVATEIERGTEPFDLLTRTAWLTESMLLSLICTYSPPQNRSQVLRLILEGISKNTNKDLERHNV